jgi:predicted dithiol-disulfide oxidoreductase (DUF899 family)
MNFEPHAVVSREEWIAARKRHLAHEKEYTRMRDQLSAERRTLPWVRIDKPYVFQTHAGERTLADLFGSHSQLVIYHFMLAPGQAEGCVGCSFLSDHLEPAAVHLEHHDVSVRLVSRAPLADIDRYRERMGWQLEWVSSHGSDFNYDFNVSFTPAQVAAGPVDYNYAQVPMWGEDAHGTSVFYKNERGEIFHTYSSYARGGEALLTTYAMLDMTPKGRNEDGNMSGWLKRHDAYEAVPAATQHCCA